MAEDDGKPDGKASGERVLGEGAGVHVGSSDPEHPPIDFGNFALSLAHSAMVDMGLVEHPEFGKSGKDLESAQQTIEILKMLRSKTAGNLDEDEEKLLTSLLYELRMAFVNASSQKVKSGS